MPLPQITALLRETLGLDVASVGASLIEHAVRRRVNANGLQDVAQYADLLQRFEPETQSLYEAVMIPETFFFRYPESFTALRKIVGERFFFGRQRIRALSLPRSTGEEPYSIVMTLLDAGLSLDNFQINAIDISTHLLDIARLGLFGSNSLRGSELQYRNQYFQKTDAGYRLCGRVCQCVNFEQANVLEEPFRFGSEPYDFIFCRNLLIYFHTGAQTQALESLRELFTADEVLFVGLAETGLLTQHQFSSVKLPMAFAFRKSEPVTFPRVPKLKPPKAWFSARTHRTEANRKPNLAIAGKATTVTRKTSLVADLGLAEQLADKGQLEEAAKISEISLRKQGPSARAFHLLRLIGDKSGDSAAAKALKGGARRVLERTK